jgi:hypothetical protein
MSPSQTSKNKGKTRYRYFICSGAQKRGWATCPTKSVPAAVIEEAVLGQLKRMGEDPASTLPESGLSFPADRSRLTPREQLRILPELVVSIDYDGPSQKLAIRFRIPESTEPLQ